MSKAASVLALGLGLSAGCYHQVVRTGLPAGPAVVDRRFVATARRIDVRRQCPSGVAVVEGRQDFMDGLLAIVTLQIYTPQHVTITCAADRNRSPE